MATDSSKPSEANIGGTTKKMIAAAKELKKHDGDLNDILKDSINLVTKLSKSYQDLGSKLDVMSKNSINTKEIERELFKARVKDGIAKIESESALAKLDTAAIARVELFTKSLEKESQLEKELLIAKSKGLKAGITLANNALKTESLKVAQAQHALGVEELSYIQLQKSYELSQASVKLGDEALAKEKEVSKSIGVSGKLMGGFANKLGIGNEYYEDLVEKAKDLQKINQKLTFGDKLKMLQKAAAGAAKETLKDPLTYVALIGAGIKNIASGIKNTIGSIASGTKGALNSMTDVNVVQKMTSGVSDLLKSIPMVGGLLGGAVDLMASFLDLVIGSSSKVQKMGRELGLSAAESLKLNNSFDKFSNSINDALVNSQKLYESQIELGNQLGVMNVLSNERLQTDIRLKEIAGLDLETRSSLVETSVILGKNQKDIVSGVFAQVNGLKQATGIQLNQKAILKEASSLGGYLGLSFAKYPEKLTKSLVTIKAMGLELKQLDSIADSFLDFESSISNEFEAQLLTGKDINLSKARELFLTNDLAGAAQEISSQVGSSADFMKMNRIQAESLAKAFGMSRDQLGDMLKKQEYMSKIGAKDTDNAQKQYQLALARYVTQEKMNAALGEENATNLMNASAQEKIAGLMDKIKQGFVNLISNSGVTEFINTAIKWISEPEHIQEIINKIQGFFATVLDVTGAVVGGIMKFLNNIPFANINIDPAMIDMVENAGSNFRSIGIGNNFASAPSIQDTKLNTKTSSNTENNQNSNDKKSEDKKTTISMSISHDPIQGKYVVSAASDSSVGLDYQGGLFRNSTK